MPPKRKISEVATPTTPNTKRRATRSKATLTETQPASKDPGLDGTYWTPSKGRRVRNTARWDDEGSLKENAKEAEQSEDEDELAVLPVRARNTAKSQQHNVFDSSPTISFPTEVVVTTSPKKKPARTYSRSTIRQLTRPPPTVDSAPEEDDAPVPSERSIRDSRKSTSTELQEPVVDVEVTPSRRKRMANDTASRKSSARKHSAPPIFEQSGDEVLLSPPPSPSKRGRKTAMIARVATMQEPKETQQASPVERELPPQASPRKGGKGKAKQMTPEEVAVLPTPSSLPKKLVLPTPVDDDTLPSITKPSASPRKRDRAASPSRLPRPLPAQFASHLLRQRKAIFRALRNPSVLPLAVVDDATSKRDISTHELALNQLRSLLKGTTERGEGNSCMLIGPRGSGKTHMIEQLLSELKPVSATSAGPIIIRLSGHAQHNDRLAMREIVRQLVQQTDLASFDIPEDEEEENLGDLIADPEENPFLDRGEEKGTSTAGLSVRLPPTAHLPSLISTLPTLGRPVVIVLDAFDLFALHARQALLYCLLDTVQHSQAATFGAQYQEAQPVSSPEKGKANAEQDITWSGLAVIGVTTRVDTLELLEKRVKSRFSGRIMRTAGPSKWEAWEKMVRDILLAPFPSVAEDDEDEPRLQWDTLWESAVDKFMTFPEVKEAFLETMSLVKDVSLVSRILMALVLSLTTEQPWPTVDLLRKATASQRCPPRFSTLSSKLAASFVALLSLTIARAALHYPAICLLIAATHARTAGHEQVTFEQLYNDFRDQVRKSTAAPVQMAGASIGMVRCSRSVLIGAFEQLVSMKIFVPVGASAGSASLSKEFVKYRCVPNREDVKQAVDKTGQTNLKKWFGKAT